MAKRKCVICGEWIEDNSQSVPHKGRYAHDFCFNIAMKTIRNDKSEKLEKASASKSKTKKKPKVELKDPMSEEDYGHKKAYYEYLRMLVGELSAKVYVLTEDYINKYGFTFEKMKKTLVYLNEIIHKDLVGDVVGIIPYYYTEAQNYYDNIEKLANENKDGISNMYQTKTIVINPRKKAVKQIDITSIFEED